MIYQIKIVICPIPIRDTLSCLPDSCLAFGWWGPNRHLYSKIFLAAANLLAKRLQVTGNFVDAVLGAAQACLNGDYGSGFELLNAFYRGQFKGHSYPLDLGSGLID